jgi:hypothetical protein
MCKRGCLRDCCTKIEWNINPFTQIPTNNRMTEPEPVQEAKKDKVKYDRTLLNQVLERDGATLVGEYENISSITEISYICKCGGNKKKKFAIAYRGSGFHCHTCEQKLRMEKQKETLIKKYGATNISQINEVKEKKKKTCFENFGVENPGQSNEIQKKMKETNESKYGGKAPACAEEVRNKMKKTTKERLGVEHSFQSKECMEKANITMVQRYGENPLTNSIISDKKKKTNVEKYGVEHPLQNKDVMEKVKNTCIQRYGFENPLQSSEVKEKSKKTCKEKYGVEYSLQAEEVREKGKETLKEKYGAEHISQTEHFKQKYKETCLERYGVEYASQSLEVQQKQQKTAHSFKEFKMPSGTIRKVQGYEPFALRDLLQRYTEEQIKTDRKEVGQFEYEVDGIKKYYTPDIFLPHEKKFIEVKSSWTVKQNPELIEKKAEACRVKGFACEVWVYNGKGERV